MKYIIAKKSNDDLDGVVNISDESLSLWQGRYNTYAWPKDLKDKELGEMYYLGGGKFRLATQQEIDAKEQIIIDETKASQKAHALEMLGLTETNLTKIKALQ